MTLTADQNERVRLAIDYLRRTRFSVWGSLPTPLDHLLVGTLETAQRVARIFGAPLDALLNGTMDIAELDGDAIRYPALARALARLEGVLPEHALKRMRCSRFGGAAEMTEEDWMETAMDVHHSKPSTRSVDDAIAEFNARRDAIGRPS